MRKNYGEFTIEIMVNFALGRIYSKFYRRSQILDLKTIFLVKKANLEANFLICKPNLWYDFFIV